MIPIHAGQAKSTVQASDVKEVQCEHCATHYHYIYRAVATGVIYTIMGLGEGDAKERAIRQAAHYARDSARGGIAPFACPHCRKIQSNMVPALRRDYQRKWQMVGVIIPAVLALLWVGIVLLETEFLDNPMPPDAVPYVIALGLCALVPFLLFCAHPWLISRQFTVSEFGSVSVPTGAAGAFGNEPPEANKVTYSNNIVM